MSITRGADAAFLPSFNQSAFEEWLSTYETLTIDLGAGDGRFARSIALANQQTAVLAVDTCGGNAARELRRAPANLRFAVADALALPAFLTSRADEFTINFPWGCLLRALVKGDDRAVSMLQDRQFTIRVNAEALIEAGEDWASGVQRLNETVARAAAGPIVVRELGKPELRAIDSTWSKRIAFGRDPRAIELRAIRPERQIRSADPSAVLALKTV